MTNIASERKQCRIRCPQGNHAYEEYGEVIECEHGSLFMIAVPYIRWDTRYRRTNFERLSPFWTPFKWRRANAALRGETDGREV